MRNCIKDGYVQTLMGRRRYLPGITSNNGHIKAHVSTSSLTEFRYEACHLKLMQCFFHFFHLFLKTQNFFRQSGRQWTQPYRALQLILLNLPLSPSRNGYEIRILQLLRLTSTQIQVTWTQIISFLVFCKCNMQGAITPASCLSL